MDIVDVLAQIEAHLARQDISRKHMDERLGGTGPDACTANGSDHVSSGDAREHARKPRLPASDALENG